MVMMIRTYCRRCGKIGTLQIRCTPDTRLSQLKTTLQLSARILVSHSYYCPADVGTYLMKHRLAGLYHAVQIGGVLLPEEYFVTLSDNQETPGIRWVLAALADTNARYSNAGYPLLLSPGLAFRISAVSTSRRTLSIIFSSSRAVASYFPRCSLQIQPDHVFYEHLGLAAGLTQCLLRPGLNPCTHMA